MEVLAMLNQYAIIFTAIMALITLIFLVRLAQLQKEIKNLKKKYTALTVGVNGENLSEIVEFLVASHNENQNLLEQAEADIKENTIQYSISHRPKQPACPLQGYHKKPGQ